MSDELIEEQYFVEVLRDPDTGMVVHETWRDSRGHTNRPGDLPACVGYCQSTGEPSSMMWYKDDLLHREDGKPAIITLNPESQAVTREVYLVNGREHRQGGLPAVIVRADNGNLKEHEYYLNGLRHRADGPAVEIFDSVTGALIEKEFWEHGGEIDANPDPNELRPN